MRAGRLRHRITLQQAAITRDSVGDDIRTYYDVADVWADVSTPGGSEYTSSDRAGAAITHQVILRTRSDVRPTWQVLWGDRVLIISAVLQDNLRRQTTLLCSEVIT